MELIASKAVEEAEGTEYNTQLARFERVLQEGGETRLFERSTSLSDAASTWLGGTVLLKKQATSFRRPPQTLQREQQEHTSNAMSTQLRVET